MRTYIKNGTAMSMESEFVSFKKIVIDGYIGSGANCNVYEAHYEDDRGIKHPCRIKELYPANAAIERKNDFLQWENDEEKKVAFQKFEASYKKLVELQSNQAIGNQTAHAYNLFDHGGTLYTLTAADFGRPYSLIENTSLEQILQTILHLSQHIKQYHENGLLHLDIKPSNFLVNYNVGYDLRIFDVDTVTSIEEVKNSEYFSYSEGYAAPEQIQCRKNDIGVWTDIYAIGCILFERIMGRAVCNEDTGIFAEWNFDGKWFENVSTKIKRSLSKIFKKSLAANRKRRYQQMDDMLSDLQEALQIVEQKTYLIENCPITTSVFVGREGEIASIQNAFHQGKRAVFLDGLMGIGKSEIAKQYAKEYKNEWGCILFVRYDDSLKYVLNEIKIANCAKEDRADSLYQLLDENVLLIVDNYDVEDPSIERFIGKYNCKFLFTTRLKISEQFSCDKDILILPVLEMPLPSQIALFENSYGQKYSALSDNDQKKVLILLKKLDGHTYLIDLYARAFRKSLRPLSDIVDDINFNGIFNTHSPKVRISKDGISRNSAIDEAVRELFEVYDFTDEQKEVLCGLSLFRGYSVQRTEFAAIALSDEEEWDRGSTHCSIVKDNVDLDVFDIMRCFLKKEDIDDIDNIDFEEEEEENFEAEFEENEDEGVLKSQHLIDSTKERFFQRQEKANDIIDEMIYNRLISTNGRGKYSEIYLHGMIEEFCTKEFKPKPYYYSSIKNYIYDLSKEIKNSFFSYYRTPNLWGALMPFKLSKPAQISLSGLQELLKKLSIDIHVDFGDSEKSFMGKSEFIDVLYDISSSIYGIDEDLFDILEKISCELSERDDDEDEQQYLNDIKWKIQAIKIRQALYLQDAHEALIEMNEFDRLDKIFPGNDTKEVCESVYQALFAMYSIQNIILYDFAENSDFENLMKLTKKIWRRHLKSAAPEYKELLGSVYKHFCQVSNLSYWQEIDEKEFEEEYDDELDDELDDESSSNFSSEIKSQETLEIEEEQPKKEPTESEKFEFQWMKRSMNVCDELLNGLCGKVHDFDWILLINAPISLTSEEKDSLFNLLNRIDQNEFYEPEVKGCSLFINQLSKEEALYVICYLLLNLNEKVELHLDRLLKYYDYILCGRGRIRKFFLLNDFNHLSGISVLMDVRDEFHSNLTEFLKDKLDGNNVIDEVSKFKKEFLPPSLKIKIINKIIEYMEKYTEEFNLRTDGFYEIYKFAYESAKEVGDEYYIGYYNYKIAKITKIIFRSNEEEDEDS